MSLRNHVESLGFARFYSIFLRQLVVCAGHVEALHSGDSAGKQHARIFNHDLAGCALHPEKICHVDFLGRRSACLIIVHKCPDAMQALAGRKAPPRGKDETHARPCLGAAPMRRRVNGTADLTVPR